MKRFLSLLVAVALLLGLCASASADDLPVLDYEGFYSRLQSEGVVLPANKSEAMAGTNTLVFLPFDLVVDKEKKLVTVTTNGDPEVIPFNINVGHHEYGHETCCRDFVETSNSDVYTAEYLDGFSEIYFCAKDSQFDLDINTMNLLTQHYYGENGGYETETIIWDNDDGKRVVTYYLYDVGYSEAFCLTFDDQSGSMISWGYDLYNDEIYCVEFLIAEKTIGEVQLIGFIEEDGSKYITNYPFPSWLANK